MKLLEKEGFEPITDGSALKLPSNVRFLGPTATMFPQCCFWVSEFSSRFARHLTEERCSLTNNPLNSIHIKKLTCAWHRNPIRHCNRHTASKSPPRQEITRRAAYIENSGATQRRNLTSLTVKPNWLRHRLSQRNHCILPRMPMPLSDKSQSAWSINNSASEKDVIPIRGDCHDIRDLYRLCVQRDEFADSAICKSATRVYMGCSSSNK